MTQKQQILARLQAAGDRGVHSFEFYEDRMPRAAARIAELRAEGHTITATRERLRGDADGVRYRLIQPPPKRAVAVTEAANVEPLFAPPPRPHYQWEAA